MNYRDALIQILDYLQHTQADYQARPTAPHIWLAVEKMQRYLSEYADHQTDLGLTPPLEDDH